MARIKEVEKSAVIMILKIKKVKLDCKFSDK